MGLSDRDYARGNAPPPGARTPSRFRDWTVVKWLIALNVAIFVLDILTGRPGFLLAEGVRVDLGGGALYNWGFYNTTLAFGEWQVWRLLSYQFLHGGLWHLAANMIGLYFFGPMVESYFGKRRFIGFYLLCGTSGAVVYSLLTLLQVLHDVHVVGPVLVDGVLKLVGVPIPLIGASGSIFGILVAAAMIAPETRVMLLFPPIPMKLRTLVIGAIVFGGGVLLFGGEGHNRGGEAAHLGGALLGFLIMRHQSLLNVFDGGVKVVMRPPGGRKGGGKGRPSRDEIDRVLDKISSQGMHSLNEKERRILEAARDDIR